jgi:hypothetical protein
MRIDSAGRILIGTTTEGHVSADNLTVAGSGDVGITIRSGASSEGSIMFSDGTSGDAEYKGWINYNQNSNFLRFFINAAERMRILSSGDVGLGTSSPTKPSSSNNSTRFMEIASGDGADLILSNNVSTNIGAGAHIGTLAFKNIDDTDGGAVPHYAGIRCESANTSGSMDLRFYIGRNNLESDAPNMMIDASGRLLLGTTTEGEADADNLTIADSGNCGITLRSGGSNDGAIFFSDGTSGADEYRGTIQYTHSNDRLLFKTHATIALTLDGSQNATFAGSVSDSKGDLRKIPYKSESSAYTLVAADSGKAIEIQGNITVPNNVFAAGDAVTLINDGGSDLTITKGSGFNWMFNTADGSNANRTLAGRGMATLYFVNTSTCYVSGAGLS